MPIYVVIDPPERVIEKKVPPNDRIKLRDRLWLVWSPHKTPTGLDEEIGLAANTIRIVALVAKLTGYAEIDVGEKIIEWRNRDD